MNDLISQKCSPPDPAQVMIRLLYSLPEPRLESLKFLAMLMTYNATGSWPKTAEVLGVSYRVINTWRRAAAKNKSLLALIDDPDTAAEAFRVKKIRANKSILAKYRDALDQVERIENLLELCRQRCKNAANFYTAGACPTNTERRESCFSGRLKAADARVLAKDLAATMRKVLKGED